jgi:glycogen(starch) synthase
MIHLPNGIDPSEFDTTPEDRHQFRAENDLIGKKIILIAGRLNRAKGGSQILEALVQIVSRVPEAILLILARPDGYAQAMLSIAETQGIRQYIRFAGWLSGKQLSAAFGAADVCVVPSVYFDNFPTVNLEAMASATPVVATCFGGSSEVVINGVTGFIVNPYDIESLAGRVIQLLTDDVMRAAMGHRSRQRILHKYDWVEQARKMIAIYEQIYRI